MTIALWIIAVVETFRAICQYKQLRLIESDTGSRDDAYKAFIDHLKETDEEFAKRLCDDLKECLGESEEE